MVSETVGMDGGSDADTGTWGDEGEGPTEPGCGEPIIGKESTGGGA